MFEKNCIACKKIFRTLRRNPWNVGFPVEVELAPGRTLRLLEILSWGKNRFICARAELDGNDPVLAMIFFGHGAKSLFNQHRIALDCISSGMLNVPAVQSVDCRWKLILSMNMPEPVGNYRDALALAALPPNVRNQMAIRMFHVLGALHRVGVGSDYLNIDGFLAAHGKLDYIPLQPLKGFSHHEIVSKVNALKNIAQLMAQLPPDYDEKLPEFCSAYTASSGFPEPSLDKIRKLCLHYRCKYVHRRLMESEKGSPEFAVYRTFKRAVVVSRRHQERLQKCLTDPENCIAQGEPLKLGTTNTVAMVVFGGQRYVIKRYNLKNWRVFLSRIPKVSRSLKAWRATQAFRLLGVPTAEPIALVRERFGPLYFRSWMVTKHIDAPHFAEHFHDLQDMFDLDEPEQEMLLSFFRSMVGGKLSHGDLKYTNLLWHPIQGPVSIDMDAARYHGGNNRAFQRQWRKDRLRFLMNWQIGTAFYRWLDHHLPPEK